ncbi:hypothetical protein [Eubacterium sp.]
MIRIKYGDNIIIYDEIEEVQSYLIDNKYLKKTNNNRQDFKVIKKRNKFYCRVSNEYKTYEFNNIQYEFDTDLFLEKSNKLVIDGNELYINIDTEKFLENCHTVLPFDIPHYCTYPMFTAIQGILKGYNNEAKWVFNNYIQLWADNAIVSDNYWTDFKFANEENREEFCPLLLRKYGDKITDNFVDTIKNSIRNKNYLLLSIDMFDVDEWWPIGDERWHWVHQILIYGFNDCNREFLTADFYKGKYKKLSLSYEKVEKGYMRCFCQHKEEKKGLFLDDLYFTYTPCEYDIDLEIIAKLIKDFLDAKDTVFFNYLNICKVNMVTYGINVIDCVKSYAHGVFQKKEHLDIRPMHFLMIINEIMKDRMHYLFTNGYVDYSKELEEIINKCVEMSTRIRNMCLKYNILYERNIELSFDILEKNLCKFKELENNMMIQCYKTITGEEYNYKHINQEAGYFDERLQIADKLLLETEVDVIYQYLQNNIAQKKIYSYKNRDVFVFPFITEIFWKGDLGDEVEESCDEKTEMNYFLNKNGKMIAHYNLSDEFYNKVVKTLMIYKYSEKTMERYIICIDEENNIKKLVAVDVFGIEDNEIVNFVRASNTNKKIICDFEYQGNVIKSGKSKEILNGTIVREYEQLFFFENANCLKQVTLIDETNEEITFFPRYGFEELDYIHFVNKLYDELCEVWDKKERLLDNLTINIIPNESRISVLFKCKNEEIQCIDKYFMKDYKKESYYVQKLAVVIMEIINKFIAKKVLDKKNDEWQIEIKCNGVIYKKYDGKHETKLLLG